MDMTFWNHSNLYASKFFETTMTTGPVQREFSLNIPPGGWMRGVRMEMRSSGGVVGPGVSKPDAQFSMIQLASLETIDGDPIIAPMAAVLYANHFKWSRPWFGWWQQRFDNNFNAISPAFSLFYMNEIRQTAGVLDNRDPDGQYRFRFTFASTSDIWTTPPTTTPTYAMALYVETWAAPDTAGRRELESVPPGANIKTIVRRQEYNVAPDGQMNILRLSNVGNYIRNIVFQFRRSNIFYNNIYGPTMEWRINGNELSDYTTDELYNTMSDFYWQWTGVGQVSVNQTAGLLAFPRFVYTSSVTSGPVLGNPWLATVPETELEFEWMSAPSPQNGQTATDGFLDITTDEVIITGDYPRELKHV